LVPVRRGADRGSRVVTILCDGAYRYVVVGYLRLSLSEESRQGPIARLRKHDILLEVFGDLLEELL
jgi:hypothetical protein